MLIALVDIMLIFFIIDIIFTNLNINTRIIEIYVKLNIMLDNIFNDNKDNHELLNIFKNVVDNND